MAKCVRVLNIIHQESENDRLLHITSEWLKSGWLSWDGCVEQIELAYLDSRNVTVQPL